MVYRVTHGQVLRQRRNTKRLGTWLLTDLEQNKIKKKLLNRFIDISFYSYACACAHAPYPKINYES